MKKYLSICLLITLIFCLLGCDKQEKQDNEVDYTDMPSAYSVLLCDYSDSVASSKKTKEYDFADKEKYDSIKPDQHKMKWIDGKLVRGEFKKVYYRGYNYYPEFDYYNDGASFKTDEKNNLTFYYRKIYPDESKMITEKEAIKIAEDFLKKHIDISEYVVETKIDEKEKEYVVTYRNYVKDVKTTEYAKVRIECDGSIRSFSSEMLGRIPELKVDDIDFEKMDQLIKDRMDEMYAESREYYDEINYGENDYKLTVLKDGSRGMICDVHVEFRKNFEEYTEVGGEILTFMIPLDR